MFAEVIASILSLLQPVHSQSCKATVFGTKGDVNMGVKTACPPYVFDPTSYGIAHRTLPCGTKVSVTLPRTGLSVEATVIDRGPYGAIMEDGEWGVKISPSDEGVWRGCADLTPALSEALGHSGWDDVVIRY